MKTFGTPHSPTALKVLLLGSGELGKEVAIELQRFAVEVIAVDRYANAPAMQVAHRSHVIDMLDGRSDAHEAVIRTFHSFGAWLLRRFGSEIGLDRTSPSTTTRIHSRCSPPASPARRRATSSR